MWQSFIKAFLFLLLLIGLPNLSFGQFGLQSTEIQYVSQYYFNGLHYNPGMAGDSIIPSVGISSRLGKVGIGSNPITVNGYIHGYLPTAKSGVGVTALYHTEDNQFKERILKLGLLYSYEVFNGSVGFLKIGFNGGILHFHTDEVPNIFNPYNPNPAPVVGLNEAIFKYNMDFGVVAGIGQWRMGGGLNHSNEPRFTFFEPSISRSFYRQAYLTVSYDIEILPERLFVRPTMMLQSEVSGNLFLFRRNNSYVDIGVLVYDQDFFIAGLHLKRSQAPYNLSFMLGARFMENYMVALSYDNKQSAGFTQYRQVEITMTYDIW